MRIRAVVPVMLVAVLVAACGRRGAGQDPVPLGQEAAPAVLRVDNRHGLPVEIWLLPSDGNRTRIAQLAEYAREEFEIAASALGVDGRIHFEADPMGPEPRQRTADLIVRPGNTILWRIDRPLSASVISVMP